MYLPLIAAVHGLAKVVEHRAALEFVTIEAEWVAVRVLRLEALRWRVCLMCVVLVRALLAHVVLARVALAAVVLASTGAGSLGGLDLRLEFADGAGLSCKMVKSQQQQKKTKQKRSASTLHENFPTHNETYQVL